MSVQFVGSGNRVCILGNAVNAQGEIRSAAQSGFREVTIGDGFLGIALVHSNRGAGGVIIESQVDGSGGNSLTVDGELAGIKHMQAAIFRAASTSATFSAVPSATSGPRSVMATAPSL